MERCAEYAVAYAAALAEAGRRHAQRRRFAGRADRAATLPRGGAAVRAAGDRRAEVAVVAAGFAAHLRQRDADPGRHGRLGGRRARAGSSGRHGRGLPDRRAGDRHLGQSRSGAACWRGARPSRSGRRPRTCWKPCGRCGHARFVLSSGCTLAVDTPAANLAAMLDAAREFGDRSMRSHRPEEPSHDQAPRTAFWWSARAGSRRSTSPPTAQPAHARGGRSAIAGSSRPGSGRGGRPHRRGLYDDLAQALAHPGVDHRLDLHAAARPLPARAGRRRGRQAHAHREAGRHQPGRTRHDARGGARGRRAHGGRLRAPLEPAVPTLKAMLADNALGRPYYVEADYLSHNGSWWSGWNDARTSPKASARSWSAAAMRSTPCGGLPRPASSRRPRPWRLCRRRRIPQGQRREYNPRLQHLDRRRAADGIRRPGSGPGEVRQRRGGQGLGERRLHHALSFPLRIFGNLGTVFDNRVWSHKFPGQTDWVELPTILPDSSDVGHHPFQAEIDHFVECVRSGRESHCNLDDAIKTHEVAFAALESAKTRQPVRGGAGGTENAMSGLFSHQAELATTGSGPRHAQESRPCRRRRGRPRSPGRMPRRRSHARSPPVKRMSITPFRGSISLNTRSTARFGPPAVAATSILRTTSLPLIATVTQFWRIRARVAANFSRTWYVPGPTVTLTRTPWRARRSGKAPGRWCRRSAGRRRGPPISRHAVGPAPSRTTNSVPGRQRLPAESLIVLAPRKPKTIRCASVGPPPAPKPAVPVAADHAAPVEIDTRARRERILLTQGDDLQRVLRVGQTVAIVESFQCARSCPTAVPAVDSDELLDAVEIDVGQATVGPGLAQQPNPVPVNLTVAEAPGSSL